MNHIWFGFLEMHMNKNTKCIGAGLVSLDILMRGCSNQQVSYKLGGTCGNVMAILAYYGWETFPIARLDNTDYGKLLLEDVDKCHVRKDFITTNDGTTPVIVQRNIVDKYGNPSHKFELLNSHSGRFFLTYKSITKKQAAIILDKLDFMPEVFFIDRVSPAILMLAKHFKNNGGLVFFEPSMKPSTKGFSECVELADIIKFADQRILDTSFANKYKDKLFIQTLGKKGLKYSLNGSEWNILGAFENDNIVDTSGAGDWTTATFLNYLKVHNALNIAAISESLVKEGLSEAQKIGALSCSFEGARGMMTIKE